MDWDGSKVVLFGGRGGPAKDDTWEFQAGVWTEIFPGASPPATYGNIVAWDGTRIVTLAGYVATFNTWGYNGATWTDLTPGTTPSQVAHPAGCYTGDYVLMFGGQTGFPVLGAVLDETWAWDGSIWTQLFPANSPAASATMSMASSQAGETILFGGPGSTDNKTFRWDPDTPDWIELFPADSPSPRSYQAMAWDGANIVLFSGFDGSYFNDTWTWDSANENWVQCEPLASPFERDLGAFSYYTPDGPIFFGGTTSGPTAQDETWQLDGCSLPTTAGAAINNLFGLGL